MKSRQSKYESGFSLLELMVALAVGVIVIGSATELFKVGMDSTDLISQRAEMQQNTRIAMNMIIKDVSMAGAGLPTGGVQLPSGGSGDSLYGRDAVVGCYLATCTYPGGNRMRGIIPGHLNGNPSNTIPAVGTVGDSITSIYVDYSFPLNQYTVTFPGAPTDGTNIVLAPQVVGLPPINDPAVGIKLGDLILLSNNTGTAVGEVTARTATTITFADLDPLNINQSAATTGSTGKIAGGAATVAYRLLAVTYFLQLPANGQLPRLMRQVSGHPAEPVADNILNLRFSFDLYDESTGTSNANDNDPTDLSQIRKVNVWILGQGVRPSGGKAQNMELASSVNTRNLSFHDRYK
jgi:prepilin-type N-terminal cleavage/methylation domain-containing protein